jgi:hypothetical protein
VERIVNGFAGHQLERSIIGPRLVPGLGGWHILDATGTPCGKVNRYKPSGRVRIVLHGTGAQIKEILSSRILQCLYK